MLILNLCNMNYYKYKGAHKNAVSIPMSIWDLDKCTHLNLRYEPDIDSRHPVSNSIDFNE